MESQQQRGQVFRTECFVALPTSVCLIFINRNKSGRPQDMFQITDFEVVLCFVLRELSSAFRALYECRAHGREKDWTSALVKALTII